MKVMVAKSIGGGVVGNGIWKQDKNSPVIIKTAAEALSVKKGTRITLNGRTFTMHNNEALSIAGGLKTAGQDVAIYFVGDAGFIVSDNFSAPAGLTLDEVVQVGGAHYGGVPAAETVASGNFATTGNGHKWVQGDVDKIRAFNEHSIWDMKLRPACADPRGFARLPGGSAWAGIYFLNSNPQVNGVSKYGSDIASGTVLPKIPTVFGGNGSATYAGGTWFNFQECLAAFGCRLPTYQEFMVAAYGVTENISEGGSSATPPLTKREKQFTSLIGLEQATGHIYTWGDDIIGAASTAWDDLNGGRGQIHKDSASPIGSIFGGRRTYGSGSGSRCSSWSVVLWGAVWSIGARAFVDSLKLD